MKNSSVLKTALVAVGGSLVAVPAAALELGEVKVHSGIGQPLRASISYALGPNEIVTDTCVTLQRNAGGTGLPSVDRASMIVRDGVIAITGSSIVREPMMSMRVSVRCQYTPQLTRDYMLFIDPAGLTSAPIEAPVAATVASRPQLTTPQAVPTPTARPAPVTTRRSPVNTAPIGATTRYRVQPGDSLSEIAQRIENRPVGLWPAVNAIFAANPDAFIDNDPNRLKAGSWLNLPDFGSATAVTVASTAEPDTAASTSSTTADNAADSVAYAPTNTAAPSVDTSAADSFATDLQPGDIVVNSDNPYVAPTAVNGNETVVIPDTILDGPATTSSSPNIPVATIQPAPASQPSGSQWLLWLGGGGIAIIIGMLLFGRRFRDRYGSTPIAPIAPQRRATDGDTQEIEITSEIEVEFAQMEIADDEPTSENLALDADLIIGTGLQDGTDVDVAQDFGFASTGTLDMELPEEMSSNMSSSETDMIPPLKVDAESILESEILPQEDDDYDMSVIVDATQMSFEEDATERDLEAVQVEMDDETLITGDYTVSQEVDYSILEQDYEDEMTATQALNLEIQKAAEDLALNMDDDVADETTEMPLATVHELDVTAQMQPKNKQDIADDDDTGLNPTVNLQAEDDTVKLEEENTVEMPKGGSKAG